MLGCKSGSRRQAAQALHVLREIGLVGGEGVVREENVIFSSTYEQKVALVQVDFVLNPHSC